MSSDTSVASNEWQLQEAKNKLSQVVKEADKGVPQFITVRGKQLVVVISANDYQKSIQPSSPLSSNLLMPILDEDDLSLFERSHDLDRAIEL